MVIEKILMIIVNVLMDGGNMDYHFLVGVNVRFVNVQSIEEIRIIQVKGDNRVSNEKFY